MSTAAGRIARSCRPWQHRQTHATHTYKSLCPPNKLISKVCIQLRFRCTQSLGFGSSVLPTSLLAGNRLAQPSSKGGCTVDRTRVPGTDRQLRSCIPHILFQTTSGRGRQTVLALDLAVVTVAVAATALAVLAGCCHGDKS